MRKVVLVILALFLVISCASKPQKKVGKPGDLYVEGVNFLNAKKYDQAIRRFSDVREEYPFDPLAFVATVKLGDAYYAKKDYLLAVGVYEEFVKSHPEDENVASVLSQLGNCYEKLSLSIDRDQAYTIKAIEVFTFLKNRHSASMYSKDVDERRARMVQKLCDRELYVGEFYYRTYQYNAAIMRLEYMVKTYPAAKGTDKALFYLSMSYGNLGNFIKADQYADRLKQEYPKSLYARARIRERKSLQLAKATGSPFQYDEKRARGIELTPQMVAKTEKQKDSESDLAFFDESKPIDIVSDGMEGFEKEKRVLFKGSVVARQDDLYIFADTMEAFTNETTNEIDKAVAKGNVKIVKRERTATANEAEFDNTTRVITLKGNVVVFSGADRVTGEIVTYYVNDDRIVVEGEKDKKARVTITPK